MKQIAITKGYYALVDDEDFEFLSKWKWCAKVEEYTVYPKTDVWKKGKRTCITMASVVMGTFPGVEIDHKDHNGLNAQKSNLRIASRSQQVANQRLKCTNTSGFKGVVASQSKWKAQITRDGRHMYLGTFTTPQEAAIAYDKAALKLYGEFAMTNSRMNLI